jgi:hypothetical protein
MQNDGRQGGDAVMPIHQQIHCAVMLMLDAGAVILVNCQITIDTKFGHTLLRSHRHWQSSHHAVTANLLCSHAK